jgi:hypothetical protein
VTTLLGTVLNYSSLRLLGLPADHPAAVKARNTLLKLGAHIGIFVRDQDFSRLGFFQVVQQPCLRGANFG